MSDRPSPFPSVPGPEGTGPEQAEEAAHSPQAGAAGNAAGKDAAANADAPGPANDAQGAAARALPDPIMDTRPGLERLLEVMRRLRDPQSGCPWDLEQDFASIAPYTIEEAHEVADAIARESWDELEAELGDLLLQVVYHAQLGREAGLFDFESIARRVSDKMIARHPHVFGDESREKSAARQVDDWERIKAAERAASGSRAGRPARALDGVALGLPALMRAQKLQDRAARVGFDWPEIEPVQAKIAEEMEELAAARQSGSRAEMAEEFGDLLFAVVNLGRHLGLDAESSLRDANSKFTHRFNAVEEALEARGKSPDRADLAEMDALWEEVKRKERL